MKGGESRKSMKPKQPQKHDMVVALGKNGEEEIENFEATEVAVKGVGEEEDPEGNSEMEKPQQEEEEGAKVEMPKLAEGYYEIEAVRGKRIRKGQLQYLIKWRGWSEDANTWEPCKNLQQCSDVIDEFEESLKTGKTRQTRRRKRKSGIIHAKIKKKQPKHSPLAATYNVPSHRVRILEGPMPFPKVYDSSIANENDKALASVANGAETTKKANENGLEELPEGRKELKELDLKLCELKGATTINEDNVDRQAAPSPEDQLTTGDASANGLQQADGLEPAVSSRCLGAKKRKSGSVKRFKKDPASNTVDDAQCALAVCNVAEPGYDQSHEFLGNSTNSMSQLEDSRKQGSIARIIKPISYQISISNNVEEVLVAFDAVRLDGTRVTVDNKFLKANHPLLLIDFYEKHLRYCGTC